jgi:hypothetical protein
MAMTEAEWLACDDPVAMLSVVSGTRALRLFSAAGCRHIWHLLTDERGRRAVEVAERFADGEATEEEREAAFEAAIEAQGDAEVQAYDRVGTGLLESVGIMATAAANAASESWTFDGRHAELYYLVGNPLDALRLETVERGQPVPDPNKADLALFVSLLREIFGNPFRMVTLDPSLLTPTVVGLAQAAYGDRHLPSGELDADRLAVLADALEEAGCADATILTHLHSAGLHVRGCWVVDLLVGKK